MVNSYPVGTWVAIEQYAVFSYTNKPSNLPFQNQHHKASDAHHYLNIEELNSAVTLTSHLLIKNENKEEIT